jgi:aryl-alcohol dehydrogenase-like predicted oxidoreductase
MACDWNHVALGSTGLRSSPLGLGSSFDLGGRDVERAFERGINYFYWGSMRRDGFAQGVRALAPRHRERMIVVLQSYARVGRAMAPAFERGLRGLGVEYADFLLLGWWNTPPHPGVLDAALRLRDRGLCRHLMISCHHRPTFERYLADPAYQAIMVRYNAAHPGAEGEVFSRVERGRTAVVAYTATRWGHLLNPRFSREHGDPVPRASDCYRFSLTNPSVDVCLAGPADGEQLDEAMAALDRGPLDDDEMAWMRRVGARVHAAPTNGNFSAWVALGDRAMRVIDRVTSRL